MAGEDRGGWGWLRIGCLGCAGVLVALATGVFVLVSLGRQAARSQDITRRNVEEVLPAARPGPGAEASVGGESDDVAPGTDTPAVAVPDFDAGRDAGAPPAAGRVLIDLSHGEFHVEPAPPGGLLRVEAEYDQKRFELLTELGEDADGSWSYEVRFRQSGGGGLSFLARLMGADDPKVTVYLPRDVPMDLDLRFSQGGGQVELGGLWLARAEVTFTQGGGELEFSEPLREPTESLSIDASMGGGAFRRLGNASPRRLSVSAQMGGGQVDLRGEWVRDAEISLESRMGGMEVRLPDGVVTRGLPEDREAPEDSEAGELPTLRFSYSSAMGEIQFRD